MNELKNKILSVVCEVCDVDEQSIIGKSKVSPLPLFRGFYWYAIRRTLGVSNAAIAKLVSDDECHYSSAGIGLGINRAINALSKEKYWQDCWEKVSEKLSIPKQNKPDGNISITMLVPKGMKNRFKIEVKEK